MGRVGFSIDSWIVLWERKRRVFRWKEAGVALVPTVMLDYGGDRLIHDHYRSVVRYFTVKYVEVG